MYMEGYFLVFPEIKKVEGPYSKEMVSRFRHREGSVVLAPPDYPQLALWADFEKWESKALALGNSDFVEMYDYMWSTFSPGEGGMVIYPRFWREDTEPMLGVETLKLLH
ncbi:hypothetical protein [Caballeronia sp. S22]|uniref:hypothetical protein n=1 Tax=Caballeronia sp. S22 TaxID=3137182 RepID=UPI00353130DA